MLRGTSFAGPTLGCALALLALGSAPSSAAAARQLVSLRVYPTPAAIPPGGAFGFGAIGTYDDGSERDVTRKAKFAASDPAVAVALGKNAFRGGAVGVSEIRATLGTIVSSQNALLSVSPIASLEIEPDEEGIRLGTRVRFGASATLVDGSEDVPVTSLLDWSSLDPAILSIGSKKKDKSLSRSLRLGATAVRARDPQSGVSVDKPIQIVDELLSVRLTPASRVMQADEARRFRAIGLFAGFGALPVEADITFDVRWLSSNRAVATLDKSGRPRVRSLGSTTFSAVDRRTSLSSSQNNTDALLIVVGAVRKLTVVPAAATVEVGEDLRFDALALFNGNQVFSWGREVEWSSSNPAVATVDDDGDALCESPGSATLVATDPKSGRTSTPNDEATGGGGDGLVTCFQPL